MKHFLYKTNEHYLCLFFHAGCRVDELHDLLSVLEYGFYKYDDYLPLYDNRSGIILTAREGNDTAKGSVSYPDGYEGYDYICIQYNLIK